MQEDTFNMFGMRLQLVFTLLVITVTFDGILSAEYLTEPQCLSRFDHDFKVIQKLAMLEDQQSELRKLIEGYKARQSPPSCPTSRQCPDSWTYFQGSCYFFSTGVNVDWIEATHHCALHHAALVKIESKDEDLFLQDYCKKLYPCPDYRNVNSFWTGASDEDVEGIWKWHTDDNRITYTNWWPGQPNDYGSGEDCLNLYGAFDFAWNDFPCTGENSHPLCEMKIHDGQEVEIVG